MGGLRSLAVAVAVAGSTCVVAQSPVSAEGAGEAAPEVVRFTRHSAQRTVAVGATAELRVACPAGRTVVGGGVDVEGGNTFTWAHASYPYDGPDADTRPDDGWAGAIANGATTARRMTTYATCAASGNFSYVEGNGTVAPGASADRSVRCAGSSRAIGGGVRIMQAARPPAVSIVSSFSANIANPFFGWIGRVQHRSTTGGSVAYRVTAICESGPAALSIRAERASATAGGSAASPLLVASCATGSVAVGGGVIMSPGVTAAAARSLHSSTPADGADAGVTPDDAWGIRVSSPSTTPFDAVVMCSK